MLTLHTRVLTFTHSYENATERKYHAFTMRPMYTPPPFTLLPPSFVHTQKVYTLAGKQIKERSPQISPFIKSQMTTSYWTVSNTFCNNESPPWDFLNVLEHSLRFQTTSNSRVSVSAIRLSRPAQGSAVVALFSDISGARYIGGERHPVLTVFQINKGKSEVRLNTQPEYLPLSRNRIGAASFKLV